MLILQLHGALYYANALTVRDQIRTLVEAADPQPRALVLDLGAQDTLDLTAAKTLIAMGHELQGRGIAAYLVDVHAPALAFARSVGVLDVIPAEHVFPTIELAVQHIELSTINGGSQP
jgi:MFS superfamily sulfate permease-like transporter